MKKNLKLYFKTLLLLLFINACTNPEDSAIIEETLQEEGQTVYHERVHGDDIPALENVISSAIGSKNTKLTLKTYNLESLGNYTVNWDDINVITDTLGIKNYALRLETEESNPLVFYNLIVNESVPGEYANPILAEYVISQEFYLKWIHDPEMLRQFTGEVYYYELDDSAISKTGNNASFSAKDGAPCPSITFGPSGANPGYVPNIYCWSYVSYGLCQTQIEYGTGTSYHGSGSCGAGTGSAIYGYGVTCSTSPGGPGPDINATKTTLTNMSPCGGGGGGPSLPGGIPINVGTPGMADIGSFVGYIDNKIHLTTAQENFLEDGPKAELILEIHLFLEMYEYSAQAKTFAKNAIEALMNGDIVDFEELFIETSTPDSFYNYQGSKALIPNPITLSNGKKIAVTFGTTQSDNQNANQKVAIDLIDGIKFAIQTANSNLSSSQQITSIHIHCTTNGKHSSTSNHSRATAVDISRINGQKMASSGVTDQIIELQKAMDKFQWVRENFGPHFKHKYDIATEKWNYNHPVKGHKDHIHFSIRK